VEMDGGDGVEQRAAREQKGLDDHRTRLKTYVSNAQ